MGSNANNMTYSAQTIATSEFYAFGNLSAHWRMLSKSYENGYRYGFNGQEKDDEVYGIGNSYTAEFWQYDPRLGRRWNNDPVDKPWISPYHAFSNKPITNSDPNGACDDCPNEAEQLNEAGKEGTLQQGQEFTDKSGKTFTYESGLGWMYKGNSTNFSSEVSEKDYGGSFEQYQNEYSEFKGMSQEEASSYWVKNYSTNYNNYWDQKVNEEKARVAVKKMAWFVQAIETENYVIGPVTGLNSFKSLSSYKKFNYTPRGTNYYPPNDGFYKGQYIDEVLQPGTQLDRYGSDFGRFLSPKGTPFNKRGLPNSAHKSQLSVFLVKKPLLVRSGKAAPAFGKYGLGIQYKTYKNVKSLLKEGYLERVK